MRGEGGTGLHLPGGLTVMTKRSSSVGTNRERRARMRKFDDHDRGNNLILPLLLFRAPGSSYFSSSSFFIFYFLWGWSGGRREIES